LLQGACPPKIQIPCELHLEFQTWILKSTEVLFFFFLAEKNKKTKQNKTKQNKNRGKETKTHAQTKQNQGGQLCNETKLAVSWLV
jgi:hypothetical protein